MGKKGCKSLDSIKILEPLHKGKYSFKGKEGMKALKTKARAGSHHRPGLSIRCSCSPVYTDTGLRSIAEDSCHGGRINVNNF